MKKYSILLAVIILVISGCGNNNVKEVEESSIEDKYSYNNYYEYYIDNVRSKGAEYNNNSEENVTSIKEEEEKDENKVTLRICHVANDISENSVTETFEYLDEDVITCNGFEVSFKNEVNAELPFEKELLIKNIIHDFEGNAVIEIYDIDREEFESDTDGLENMEERYKDEMKYSMFVYNDKGAMLYYFNENEMIFIGERDKELN